MYRIFRKIIVLFCLLLCYCISFSQNPATDTLPSQSHLNVPVNFISLGFDKIVHTYTTTANALIDLNSEFGNIQLLQNYRGIGLKQSSGSFRDDEVLKFHYSYPVTRSFNFVFANNVIYSNDSRSIGLNELSRVNFSGGLNYSLGQELKLELMGGYESNKQLGKKSPGSLLGLNILVSEIKLDNFILNGNVTGEYLSLDNRRRNGDMDVSINSFTLEENNNLLSLNLRYKLSNRDFYSNIDALQLLTPIESRFDGRLLPSINIKFGILDNMFARFNVMVSNSNIDRSFREPIEGMLISKVQRHLSEFIMGINSEVFYNTDRYSQSIGLFYNVRNEKNGVTKLYEMTSQEEQQVKAQEFLRDNNTIVTKLIGRSNLTVFQYDSLILNYSVSLLQYNTPSEENYDDRDEQVSLFGGLYYHRFSNEFSGVLGAELQMVHQVYLKSQRSSLNNWNRSILLSPGFNWINKYFIYSARFDLLANYTVYDFEDISPGIKSYSYRQMAYRDSLTISITDWLKIQSKITFRYFERGILFWSTFSESPQNSNLEYFHRILAITEINSSLILGFGIRFYSLNQKNIGGINVTDGFKQHSWGPETALKIIFPGGTSISLQGWYEFQYINGAEKFKIPNLFLVTNYKL